MLLRDKVVIISGIGPGMGKHLAVHAATEGARAVVITARRQENLDMVAAEIKDSGADAEVLAFVNDIRDLDGCKRVADGTVERFGAIDALINNANHHGPMHKVSEGDLDEWLVAFEGNVIGTMKMCRAVLDQMKKQGKGFIVNVNTMGSRTKPVPYQAIEACYDSGKAGLTSATRSLADEVGRYGIRVNGLHPGFMMGPSVKPYLERRAQESNITYDELYDALVAHIALKRMPTDEEVALATLFLASDYAGAVTGAILDANGGHFMP